MNRANQQQLFQATNQGLLGIRQSEVNYYQSLNVAFGTQAALIGGFTYGVFSQNQINENNGYALVDVLADVYWICSAITIALAVHVILCTMLMQVLGPGLALNGPVGSMARATEGMRVEQKPIIIVFILMMIMFSVSTVLSCWVVMSFQAALGCNISFVIAACCWYYYCERIYLRFFWESEEATWARHRSSVDSTEDAINPMNVNPVKEEDSNVFAAAKVQRHKNHRQGLFGALFHRPMHHHESDDVGHAGEPGAKHEMTMHSELAGGSSMGHSVNHSMHSTATGRKPTVQDKILAHDAELDALGGTDGGRALPFGAPSKRGLVLEGYLTKQGGGAHSHLDYHSIHTEPWERRYFTLSGLGNLFIYKNRQEFRTDPKNPIYTRPLRLEDYYIEVYNMGDFNHDHNVRAVMDTNPGNMFHFQMTLVLRENVDNPELSAKTALAITAAGAGVSASADHHTSQGSHSSA